MPFALLSLLPVYSIKYQNNVVVLIVLTNMVYFVDHFAPFVCHF